MDFLRHISIFQENVDWGKSGFGLIEILTILCQILGGKIVNVSKKICKNFNRKPRFIDIKIIPIQYLIEFSKLGIFLSYCENIRLM